MNNYQPTPYPPEEEDYLRAMSKLDGSFTGPDLPVDYSAFHRQPEQGEDDTPPEDAEIPPEGADAPPEGEVVPPEEPGVAPEGGEIPPEGADAPPEGGGVPQEDMAAPQDGSDTLPGIPSEVTNSNASP